MKNKLIIKFVIFLHKVLNEKKYKSWVNCFFMIPLSLPFVFILAYFIFGFYHYYSFNYIFRGLHVSLFLFIYLLVSFMPDYALKKLTEKVNNYYDRIKK